MSTVAGEATTSGAKSARRLKKRGLQATVHGGTGDIWSSDGEVARPSEIAEGLAGDWRWSYE